MPTPPDPFDEFLRQIDPLMQVQQSYTKRSVVLMGKLDIACIAVKCGNPWTTVSGKAVLRACPRESGTQLAKIAQLPEIVAFEGYMPAKEVNSLIADLKDSWVLRCENVRLTTGGRNYNWRLPHLIKASNRAWEREFALHGYGPDLSSLLSGSTLQKIDRDLRLCTPAFDGFDGLCARLDLPARRDNLTSSFQLSAELPAIVFNTYLRLPGWNCDVSIYDFGVPPDVTVEWLPQHELQRTSDDQISWADDPDVGRIVSIPITYDSEKAKVTLWRGELRADVVTVNLGLGNDEPADFEPLEFEREEPTAPDFALRKLGIMPETPTGFDPGTGESPKQKRPGPLFPRSRLAQITQELLLKKRDATAREICGLLDEQARVRLPKTWKNDPNDRSFEDAYDSNKLMDKYISRVRTRIKAAKL